MQDLDETKDLEKELEVCKRKMQIYRKWNEKIGSAKNSEEDYPILSFPRTEIERIGGFNALFHYLINVRKLEIADIDIDEDELHGVEYLITIDNKGSEE